MKLFCNVSLFSTSLFTRLELDGRGRQSELKKGGQKIGDEEVTRPGNVRETGTASSSSVIILVTDRTACAAPQATIICLRKRAAPPSSADFLPAPIASAASRCLPPPRLTRCHCFQPSKTRSPGSTRSKESFSFRLACNAQLKAGCSGQSGPWSIKMKKKIKQ